MPALTLALLAFAAYRLTRLVVSDVILDRPRNWLFTHGPLWLSELLNCVHCVGVWVALSLSLLAYLAPTGVVNLLLLPAALAGAVSLLAARDGR